LFFVLERGEHRGLEASLRGASVRPAGNTLGIRVELNGETVADIELIGEEPKDYDFTIPRAALREGLNRIVFHYEQTGRLNRRHREAALAFFNLALERE
jgi:hypothetical protein